MTMETEKAEIRAVLEAVRQAHHDKDAAAICAQFAADAVIFDLAPPLAHGVDAAGLAAWLDGWDGPVDIETGDLAIAVGGDLAFCYGLSRVSARTRGEREQAEWWQRVTVCLRRTDGAWKIVNEHTSVPFLMDGSFRAAIDLAPEPIGAA